MPKLRPFLRVSVWMNTNFRCTILFCFQTTMPIMILYDQPSRPSFVSQQYLGMSNRRLRLEKPESEFFYVTALQDIS